MLPFGRRLLYWTSAVSLGCVSLTGAAQQEKHGRGYKAPPPTAEVVVVVEKAFNQKPFPNASVIFRAMRDDKITANLETKTDPDGRASLDLLEIGSHVTIQVIAGGFATYATDFDLSPDGKQLLVKLERPRAQVSQYGDAQDKPAPVRPGVQEHINSAPATSLAPPVASPTGPLKTTPPADTPANTAPVSQTPAKPGNPQ